jgi:hypothetical protein
MTTASVAASAHTSTAHMSTANRRAWATDQAAPPETAAHLRRLRWGVRATLTLGVAASVAANILHAHPNPISQIIAAWPPLALLLTVELISRVPTHRRALAAVRLAATAGIAGIAAWVSYWHMAGVAARYGETEAAASYLLPLSVDGLVIVASVSLVEIAGRIRTGNDDDASMHPTSAGRQPADSGHHDGVPAAPLAASLGDHAPAASAVTVANKAVRATPERTTAPQQATAPAGSDTDGPATAGNGVHGRKHDDDDAPSDTAAAVAYWHRHDPRLHPAEIAARIGRSERTVRRYWSATATATAAAGRRGTNGRVGS